VDVPPIEPEVDAIANAPSEDGCVDFKAEWDLSPASWCELVKDLVAMANSGGGAIVFGVSDGGSPSSADLTPIFELDPAKIADRLRKYTGIDWSGVRVLRAKRGDHQVAVLRVEGARLPIVFTSPGSYDAGGNKQKVAFSVGTVYFRHGPKSEPGTSEDLRQSLERELERIRSSWLDGIQKVVTAPIGATVTVSPSEVRLSGAEDATGVRLVNDENAPAFKAMRTDLLYPFRLKEVVAEVNKLLKGALTVTGHDVMSVRKAHHIDGQPNFFYKPQFSSPQYSQAFAEWMVEQFYADLVFFAKAREATKHAQETPK
jgi:hypothetical protein